MTENDISHWYNLVSMLLERTAEEYTVVLRLDDRILEIWGEDRLITTTYNKDVSCWYSNLIPFLDGYELGRYYKDKCTT